MIEIKGNKEKLVIMVLLLITIISLGVTIYTLLLTNKDKEVLAPDYAKPEVEENAEPFGDQNLERYEQSENGGGAVDITYEKDVKIDLSENKVYLSFGNPAKSNQDMLLQIIIDDVLISESGMIQSGNRVTELKLQDNVDGTIVVGQYEGEIRVYFYDCVSAEKAMVNANIPVIISVNE